MDCTIETPRLLLRLWKASDLPLFAAINADERVMEHFPRTLSQEESDAFAERIVAEFKAFGWGLYAVELKSTARFIGYCGFHNFSFEAEFSPEIGRASCRESGILTRRRDRVASWPCPLASRLRHRSRASMSGVRSQQTIARPHILVHIHIEPPLRTSNGKNRDGAARHIQASPTPGVTSAPKTRIVQNRPVMHSINKKHPEASRLGALRL